MIAENRLNRGRGPVCAPGRGWSRRLTGPPRYPQQGPRAACTGGQGTVPYEQNTQQSPGFGLSSAPQPPHS